MVKNSSVQLAAGGNPPSVSDAYSAALKKVREAMMSGEFKRLYSKENARTILRELKTRYENNKLDEIAAPFFL